MLSPDARVFVDGVECLIAKMPENGSMELIEIETAKRRTVGQGALDHYRDIRGKRNLAGGVTVCVATNKSDEKVCLAVLPDGTVEEYLELAINSSHIVATVSKR